MFCHSERPAVVPTCRQATDRFSEFYLKCVSCSICFWGGFRAIHHRVCKLSSQTLERIERHSYLANFISFCGCFALSQDSLAAFLLFGLKQVTEFQKRALGVLAQACHFVSQSNLFSLRTITLGHCFGLGDYLFNLFGSQPRRGCNPHLLFAPGRFVDGRNRYDSVRVDFKRDFDLWHASRRRGNSHEFKFAKTSISAGYVSLTLQDVNFYRRLVVDDGRKIQTVAKWNRRISFNNSREQSTARFQSEA